MDLGQALSGLAKSPFSNDGGGVRKPGSIGPVGKPLPSKIVSLDKNKAVKVKKPVVGGQL